MTSLKQNAIKSVKLALSDRLCILQTLSLLTDSDQHHVIYKLAILLQISEDEQRQSGLRIINGIAEWERNLYKEFLLSPDQLQLLKQVLQQAALRKKGTVQLLSVIEKIAV